MSDRQKVTLVKSDGEKVIDALSSFVGLAILTYMLHPEPFQNAYTRLQAWWYAWVHRVSIWDARQAIRSLPETDGD